MNIMVHVPAQAQGQASLRVHHRPSLLSSPLVNGNDDVQDDVYDIEEPRGYQPSQQHTYSSCYGLPYQDHNYGAPPPPTPPASPPPVAQGLQGHNKMLNGHIDIEDISGTTEVITTEVNDDSDHGNTDDSVTRCICDFQHDDGYMICCDKCSVWQHVDCMGVDRNDIPDKYLCELCEPRKVEKAKAVALQIKKRQEIAALDTSATETEDETIKLGINTGPIKRPKTRRKRKERDKPDKVSRKVKKDVEKKVRKIKANNTQTPGRRRQSALRKINVTRKSPKSPKSPRSPKSLAPNMTANLSEDALDSWSSMSSKPVGDVSSNTNQYSPDMQRIMAGKKFNGQHSTVGGSKPWEQLLAQLCQVSGFKSNKKGLEAAADLDVHQPIVEYKGKVMLREQYDKENMFFKKNHPFVLFYANFEGLDLCVDASVFGNDARYVRRSCVPNSEVQHVVENCKVRFYIYSSKEISQGTEVTIPFDFNYQECNYDVECACSRPNCPIAKFHKKSTEGQTRPRKRRRTLSTDQKSVTIAETTSNKSNQGNGPAGKRRRSAPVSDLSPAPILKTEEGSSRPQRSSQSSQHGNSECETPDIQVKSSPMSPTSNSNAAATVTSPEEESEEAERRKKMTREERKMEAIMKAFEKLEKREERRREALARMDGKKPGPRGERSERSESLPALPAPKEEIKEEEKKVEVVSPEPKIELRPKLGRGKKKKLCTPARRKSRLSSSTSNAADPASSADESSNQMLMTTPITPHIIMSGGENSDPTTPSSSTSGKAFRFPKTKKHMMNEWFNEKSQDLAKPLTIKTEPLEVNTAIAEENAEFVKCMPSPHANSLSHLRRHSMSGCSQTKTAASTAVVSVAEVSLGSAKKRWLRQAMYERTSVPQGIFPTNECMSPVHSGGASPNPNHTVQAHSPASSPIDFVTPLKKRRMARESLSQEAGTLGTPAASVSGQQDGLVASTPLDHLISEGERSASDNEESLSHLPNGMRPYPVIHKIEKSSSKDEPSSNRECEGNNVSDFHLSTAEDQPTQQSVDSGFKSQLEADETSCGVSLCSDVSESANVSNNSLPEVAPSIAAPSDSQTEEKFSDNVVTQAVDKPSVSITDHPESKESVNNSVELPEQTCSSTALSEPKGSLNVCEDTPKLETSDENNEVGTSDVDKKIKDEVQPECSTKSDEGVSNVSDSGEPSDVNDVNEADPVESSADINKEVSEKPQKEEADEAEACSAEVLSKSLEGDVRDATESGAERIETSNEATSSSGKETDTKGEAACESSGRPVVSTEGSVDNACEAGCSNSLSISSVGTATGDIEVHSSGANTNSSVPHKLSTSSEIEEGELVPQSTDDELVTNRGHSSVEESSSSNFVSSSSGRYKGLSPRSPRTVDGMSPRSDNSAVAMSSDSNQGVDSTWAYDSAVDLNVSSSSSLGSCKTNLKSQRLTSGEQVGPGPGADLDQQGVTSSLELSPPTERTDRVSLRSGFNKSSGCTDNNISVSHTVSSSSATSSLSPVSSCASTSFHLTNTNAILPETCSASSGKKKVSLLEYRKRMKQRSEDGPQGDRGSRSNSTDGRTTPGCSSGPSSPRSLVSSLAPLPLFSHSATSPGSSDRSVSDVTSSRRIKGKDDQDVRWSSPVKSAPPLSLTERLRREFGVDASESEDDDDRDIGLREDSPPPPPPPPPRLQLNNGTGLYQGGLMMGMGTAAGPNPPLPPPPPPPPGPSSAPGRMLPVPPPPPPPQGVTTGSLPMRPVAHGSRIVSGAPMMANLQHPPPPPPAPSPGGSGVPQQQQQQPPQQLGRPIPSLMSISSFPSKPFNNKFKGAPQTGAASGGQGAPPPPPPPHRPRPAAFSQQQPQPVSYSSANYNQSYMDEN